MSQALSWILKEQWKSPALIKHSLQSVYTAQCTHKWSVYVAEADKEKQVRAICHVTENSLNRAVREDLTMRKMFSRKIPKEMRLPWWLR